MTKNALPTASDPFEAAGLSIYQAARFARDADAKVIRLEDWLNKPTRLPVLWNDALVIGNLTSPACATVLDLPAVIGTTNAAPPRQRG